MAERRRLTAVRGLVLGLCAAVALDVSAAELGIVYVRANVGSASGGHAALVAGADIFHMQVAADGLVRLTRDRWEHFRYMYADLQNRPLEVAFLALDRERGTRARIGYLTNQPRAFGITARVNF